MVMYFDAITRKVLSEQKKSLFTNATIRALLLTPVPVPDSVFPLQLSGVKKAKVSIDEEVWVVVRECMAHLSCDAPDAIRTLIRRHG